MKYIRSVRLSLPFVPRPELDLTRSISFVASVAKMLRSSCHSKYAKPKEPSSRAIVGLAPIWLYITAWPSSIRHLSCGTALTAVRIW